MIEFSVVNRLVRMAGPTVLAVAIASTPVAAQEAKPPEGIIHESECQRLWAKNGERWAAEDTELQRKLDELEKEIR